MQYDICVRSFDDYMKESMDDGTVDLILTDPPYNISRKTGFKNGKLKKFNVIDMDFGEWDHEEIDLGKFIELSYQKLRKGGTIIVWYDLWKLGKLSDIMKDKGFVMLRQIIWQKTNPVPINMKRTYLSNAREMAVVAVKGGKPTFNSEYDRGEYLFPIPQPRQHPTQKPYGLFAQLVLKHSNEGDLVLDPFMGSGTTLDACLEHNRDFMGCDINEKYFDIVQERVVNMEGVSE